MDIAAARRWYAEELRYAAPIRSERVVSAFATVPREDFLGPPPWLLVHPSEQGPPETKITDPVHLYHNVLVAIDNERGLNNGEPRLWATLYDKLALNAGERVLHVGAGTGYYSAILAEIVGAQGHVTAVEFDAALAARAQASLARYPQVTAVRGDGCVHDAGKVDVIVVNAGVTHPQPLWLDRLRPGGRLLVPLTTEDWWGHFLMVTRQRQGYGASFVSRVGIFHCASSRDTAAAKALAKVFGRAGWESLKTVRSLRRNEPPDESCVLAGPGYWLSSEVAKAA